MRTQLRIVAGALRGRKLTCTVTSELRPAPQAVREALFSILGAGIKDKAFIDAFAGTGAVGFEALSRGARPVTFIERDNRAAAAIDEHLKRFEVRAQGRIIRSDVFLWARRWSGDANPLNIFLGPPFAVFEQHPDWVLELLGSLQEKLAPGSVLVLQAEETKLLESIPDTAAWDRRQYGRNLLLFWVKPETGSMDGIGARFNA